MSAPRFIRRWLGIPTREEIRAQILREIDADAAWGSNLPRSHAAQREARAHRRDIDIELGLRENTRD